MKKNLQELTVMLNKGLELEHAARIQYLSHAEILNGPMSEPLRARLREIAGDEAKHEGMFRTLISDYLNSVPSTGIAETKQAENCPAILKVNLSSEKDAIDFYRKIYKKVKECQEELVNSYETFEHEIRHIIIEEQEHVVELEQLIER